MLTLSESAAFALGSYGNVDLPIPDGFRYGGSSSEGSPSGFHGEYFPNDLTGEIVVAFRGTDEFRDATSFPGIALGSAHRQSDEAVAFLASIIEKHPHITHIHVVGHSLGDNNAQHVLREIALAPEHAHIHFSGVGFNGPGIGQAVASPYGNLHYVHVDTRADLVNLFGGSGIVGPRLVLDAGPGVSQLALATALAQIHPILGTATLGRNLLDAHSMQALHEFLLEHPEIGSLDVQQLTHLTPADIAAINANPSGWVQSPRIQSYSHQNNVPWNDNAGGYHYDHRDPYGQDLYLVDNNYDNPLTHERAANIQSQAIQSGVYAAHDLYRALDADDLVGVVDSSIELLLAVDRHLDVQARIDGEGRGGPVPDEWASGLRAAQSRRLCVLLSTCGVVADGRSRQREPACLRRLELADPFDDSR